MPLFCHQYHTDSSFSLKENHPYYYRCQFWITTTVLATEKLYCDSVVWAPTGAIHDKEQNQPNIPEVFALASWKILSSCYNATVAGKVVHKGTIIMLWKKKIQENGATVERLWVVRTMTVCENPSCTIKWFRLACSEPLGKWIFPTCHHIPPTSDKRSKWI